MANNNETTTKFKVDISELKKAMQDAKRQVALANSEFKAVSSTMDDWSKSSDGLRAKLKQLDSNLNSQKTILNNLERQYELTVAEMGEGSKAAEDLRVKINNQKAVIGNVEKEIRNFSDALDEVTEAEKIAARSGQDVEDVLKDMADEAQDTGEGFTILKGAVAEFTGEALTSLVDTLKDGAKELITFGDEADKAINNLQAATGTSAKTAEELDKVMKNLYNSNYGESFEDIAAALTTIMQTSLDWDTESIEDVAKNAFILRDTFGYEIAESMRAVNMLMQQFGVTSEEAFDLIARGTQVGLNKNGDLLDVINEYGVHYANMGVTAEGFFNSLINGTNAGTFSVDKLGDAYKEFGIRAKDGSESTADAFKALGLTIADNSEAISDTRKEIESYKDQISKLERNIKYAKMQQEDFTDKTSELTKLKTADNIASWTEELDELKSDLSISTKNLELMEASAEKGGQSARDLFKRFAEGGDEAQAATQEVLAALMSMEDKVEQDAAGVALFGSMWEDLGKDGVAALMDISSQTDSLENVYDTMEQINEVKYDSVGDQIETFGRNLKTSIYEPVSDEILPIISDLMDELGDSGTLDEFSDSIVDISKNVLKTFGTMLKFTVKNLDTLVGVTGTAVTTYASFKAALSIANTITGVKNALSALSTTASKAAKAQTILNTAMSSNVIGAVASAVGLLTVGLVSLASSTGAAKKEQDLLTESQRAAVTKGAELAEAYRETVAAADELAASEMAQIDYTERLWGELKNLASANGEVQDIDKARAEFILGELNEALGTEYTMNGNIIGQYAEMVSSIESLITAKRAQILLQAYEESYAQAVQNSAELEKARSIAAQELYAQEQVALEKKQAAEALYEQWKGEFDARTREMYKQMYDDALREYEDSAELLEKKQKKYDETSQTVNDAYNLIDSYETASTLVLEGETQQAIQLLNRYGNGFVTAASMVNKSKKEQLKILRQQVIDTEVTLGILEAEYEAAQESMTEEERRQAQLRIDNAREQAAAAKEEYAAVGGNMIDGMVAGVDGKSWSLVGSLKDTVNNAVDAAKKALGIHSPSRVLRDEVGKMMSEGIGVGITDNTKGVLSSMRDLTSSAVSVAREGLGAASAGLVGATHSIKGTSASGGVVNNFYQTNNSPKALSRLDIYRQSKNLLGYAGGVR